MRVTKTGTKNQVARWSYFWHTIPPDCRPKQITSTATTVSYEYEVGRRPRSWRRVYLCAQKAIWGTAEQQAVTYDNRLAYSRYVLNRAREADLDGEKCHRVLLPILHDYLHPVTLTHGDLTLANCVATPDGRIVFIDPGNDWGLTCREIDEAKLMQSLDGFRHVYEGDPMPDQWPRFLASSVHYALLYSHYVRMLRHVRPVGVTFARARIAEIEEMTR